MKVSTHLPNGCVVLWNKLPVARTEHTLKCGCKIKPGQTYHSVGAKLNNQFKHYKQHALGLCLDGPSAPIPVCVARAMH